MPRPEEPLSVDWDLMAIGVVHFAFFVVGLSPLATLTLLEDFFFLGEGDFLRLGLSRADFGGSIGLSYN